MRYIILILSFLLLFSYPVFSRITIGVTPAKVIVNLTEKECKTIEFRFWNRGNTVAYFTILFPKGLNHKCEDCENFIVPHSTPWYNYVTKNITFCRSLNGTYIISVIGKEKSNIKHPITIAAGIKLIMFSPYSEKTEDETMILIILILIPIFSLIGWKIGEFLRKRL